MMKSILFTLPFLFIPVLFGFNEIPANFFTVGKNSYSLSAFHLVNESYSIKSKFEIDLMTEKEDLATAKTYLYFSVTGDNTAKLSNGIYQFSSGALNDRLPFQFNGYAKINDHSVKITEGTISLENKKEEYDIHFILKLQNGDIAKGAYRGKAIEADRSRAYK